MKVLSRGQWNRMEANQHNGITFKGRHRSSVAAQSVSFANQVASFATFSDLPTRVELLKLAKRKERTAA